MGKKLCDKLETLFEGVDVRPSVLHGDLWSGNIGSVGDGQPAIFDPATYYGTAPPFGSALGAAACA